MSALLCLAVPLNGRVPDVAVSEADVALVKTAILDEVYANGWEKEYFDVGVKDLPLYVKPTADRGMVWIIYRLMPYRGPLVGAGATSRGGSDSLDAA